MKAKFWKTTRVMFISALAVMLGLVAYGLIYAATPSTFVSVATPISVVATTNSLLYSQYCGEPNHLHRR